MGISLNYLTEEMGMDDFMNYMGYRNMVIENKIKECLSAARRGETEISIDRGDLTDDETAYLQKEGQRRIQRGNY